MRSWLQRLFVTAPNTSLAPQSTEGVEEGSETNAIEIGVCSACFTDFTDPQDYTFGHKACECKGIVSITRKGHNWTCWDCNNRGSRIHIEGLEAFKAHLALHDEAKRIRAEGRVIKSYQTIRQGRGYNGPSFHTATVYALNGQYMDIWRHNLPQEFSKEELTRLSAELWEKRAESVMLTIDLTLPLSDVGRSLIAQRVQELSERVEPLKVALPQDYQY